MLFRAAFLTALAAVVAREETNQLESAVAVVTPGQSCDNITVTLFPTYNKTNPCGSANRYITMFLERESCYAFKAAAISIPASPRDSAITLSPVSNSCAGQVQNFPMQADGAALCITLINDDGTPHTPLSGYWSCIAG